MKELQKKLKGLKQLYKSGCDCQHLDGILLSRIYTLPDKEYIEYLEKQELFKPSRSKLIKSLQERKLKLKEISKEICILKTKIKTLQRNDTPRSV